MQKLLSQSLMFCGLFMTIAAGIVSPLPAQDRKEEWGRKLNEKARSILREARESIESIENQDVLFEILVSLSSAGDTKASLELDRLISKQMKEVNAVLKEKPQAMGDFVDSIFDMIQAGQLETAIQIVSKIENRTWKGYMLALIAQGYSEAGEHLLAQEYLRQAIHLAASSSNIEEQERALIGIARAQVTIGDYQGANKTIEAIAVSEEKSIVYWDMVRAMLKKNDIEGAFRITKEIQHNSSRAGAILTVAGKATDDDNFGFTRKLLKQAALIVQDIPEGAERDSVLHSLAWQYARAGQATSALEIANKIGAERERGFLLVSIVGELAKDGNYDDSFQVLDTIQDSRRKQEALERIAVVLARQGDVSGALGILENMTKGLTREIAKDRIASARAWVGDIETAIRVLKMQESPREMSRNAASLVFSLAEKEISRELKEWQNWLVLK